MRTVPLIVDVDTGIDDALALLYLISSPEAEILTVASTAGNVPAARVAANNLAWLDLCGRPDIEVTLGSPGPLADDLRTTEETHGSQGLGYAHLDESSRALSTRSSAQAWVDIARARPGAVTGLVTGPLTNLALALRIEPKLPTLLHRLVVMGGAFNHPGNTTPKAEWNISVDPEAAKEVFDAFSAAPADRRPLLCGLDITETIEMRPGHLRRLAEAAGSTPDAEFSESDPAGTRSRTDDPVLRALSDAVLYYFEFHREHGHGFLAHMHDPFAAALALDPTRARTRPATVDVELAGTLTRGCTVADWRGVWKRAPNADIVVGTDPDAFFDDLVDRIGGHLRARRDRS